MSAPQVLSGSRAIIKNAISGKIIVTADTISYSQTIARAPVDTLGSFLTQEHVPLGVSVAGSLSGFRIPGQPPELQAGGLMPLVQQLLTEEAIVITEEDRATGQTIASIEGCKLGDWTENVSARDLNRWSANFVGIVIKRENAPNNETGSATSIFNN